MPVKNCITTSNCPAKRPDTSMVHSPTKASNSLRGVSESRTDFRSSRQMRLGSPGRRCRRAGRRRGWGTCCTGRCSPTRRSAPPDRGRGVLEIRNSRSFRNAIEIPALRWEYEDLPRRIEGARTRARHQQPGPHHRTRAPLLRSISNSHSGLFFTHRKGEKDRLLRKGDVCSKASYPNPPPPLRPPPCSEGRHAPPPHGHAA